jgi:predicted aspartyl protease
MNIPHALFLWQEAYIRAVCETDDSLMMSRIYEARAAIGQRRLTPVVNEDEAGLQSMITERTSKTV